MEENPPWVRPALGALLALTAVLYLWGLGSSGWANSFYSAAVQAGTRSWRAMFFGSFDAASSITVDKPPAALWVMDASARLFGVNAWSLLVPQALEGVATVWVLYAAIKRWFGPVAGLLAGAVVAATPVAALMFRFNNPDALLVLLLVASGYALTRALEHGSTRWLAATGALIGLGFLTKMLQALLVVPFFAIAYLVAGPPALRTRIRQLVVAGGALVVAGGWWVLIVDLWPASSRPYIGGSTDNSVLNLIFGYNGFGRLTGNETGSVGGGGRAGVPGGAGRWGATGILRLFNAEMGGTISWLLPGALVLLVAGLIVSLRSPRADRTRSALTIWGGWLVLTGLVFSLGKGIIHPYYNVALAPAIGAVIGIGGVTLWRRRVSRLARLAAMGALGVTVWWSRQLLARTPAWQPWLRTALIPAGVVAGVLVLISGGRRGLVGKMAAVSAVAVGLVGTGAYTLATAAQAHAGGIPSVGPAGAPSGFGPAGGPGGPGRAGAGGRFGQAGGPAGRFAGGLPGGPLLGLGGGPPPGFGGGPLPGTGGGPRGGGLLNASTPTAPFVAALRTGAKGFKWVAATVGANEAAGYQLASGDPVMPIGGFNGTDPSPTLAQFKALVAGHRIHYFIAGGRAGPGPGATGATASQITTWVESSFTSTTIGGTTVYDLTGGGQRT